MFPLPSPDSSLWFAVSSLAVWRGTALICYDRGPFAVLVLIRRGLARVGLHRLVTCFHCTSVWVALLVAGVVYERRPMTLLMAAGMAGAASIAERWLGGGAPREEENELDS